MDKKIIIIITLLCFLGILLFFALFRIPMTDDYAFFVNSSDGVIKAMFKGYMQWDGRMISITSFVQHSLIYYLGFSFTRVVWLISFLVSILILQLFLIKEFTHKNSLNIQIATYIILVFSVWFGMKNHISQTIYWAVGGAYTFNMLLFFCWYVSYSTENGKFKPLSSYIFSFIIGASTQNLLTIPFTIVFFDLLQQKSRKKYLHLILIILGAFLITLAPGNVIRSNTVKSFELVQITSNYYFILLLYLKNSIYLILFGFISGFIISLQNTQKIKPNLLLKKSAIWLLASLTTIIPFAIVSKEFALIRTSIYFQIALFITILYLSFYIKQKFRSKFIKFQMHKEIIIYSYLILVLTFFAFKTVPQIFDNYRMHKEFISREQYINKLKSENHMNIVVKEIKTANWASNFLLRIYDIPDNTNTWMSRYTAKYYKLDSIKTKK